ncbi:phage virion morphogenesis protein [Tistrella bauzanensis]|uniref:phage virion morphogenesis protein n=1 Tax=Tistrella TaxID=171436 RepID=UPI0031F6A32B
MTGHGTVFSVDVDDREAQAYLREMMRRMDHRRGFYEGVRETLHVRTQDSFRAETAPDGTPWAPLKPATIRARERQGHTPITILRRNKSTASLAGSINFDATDDRVSGHTTTVYGGVHQTGATIQIPARSGKVYSHYDPAKSEQDWRFTTKKKATLERDVQIPAHAITIPARPYLGVSKADEDYIVDLATDWIGLE